MPAWVFEGRTGHAERFLLDVRPHPDLTLWTDPVQHYICRGFAHAATIYVAAPTLIVAQRGITPTPRLLRVSGGRDRGPGLPLGPGPPEPRSGLPSFPNGKSDSGPTPGLNFCVPPEAIRIRLTPPKGSHFPLNVPLRGAIRLLGTTSPLSSARGGESPAYRTPAPCRGHPPPSVFG